MASLLPLPLLTPNWAHNSFITAHTAPSLILSPPFYSLDTLAQKGPCHTHKGGGGTGNSLFANLEAGATRPDPRVPLGLSWKRNKMDKSYTLTLNECC